MRVFVVLVCAAIESSCLRVQLKAGDKSHLRLNTTMRPIANKYREGKLQRTLKRVELLIVLVNQAVVLVGVVDSMRKLLLIAFCCTVAALHEYGR